MGVILKAVPWKVIGALFAVVIVLRLAGAFDPPKTQQ